MSASQYDPLNNYGGLEPVVPDNRSPLLPRQVLSSNKPGSSGSSGITLAQVFPVGCIYISTVATNPSDPAVLGFGTWAAYGSGRVLVGFAAGDPDFGTGGATPGAKTVDTTHNHPLSDAGQAQIAVAASTPSVLERRVNGAAGWTATHQSDVSGSGSSSGQTKGAALMGSTDNGGSSALDVIQPSIVVYIWHRTA